MATPIQYQDPTLQLLSSLLGSKTSTTTQANPAATQALEQLLAQMQASSTPEGMAALMGQLFQAGAQKVPELTQAYANAAGARSTQNSGLQLALGDLNKEITNQAATQALQQQSNMATVAANLARATGTQTQTTGLGGNPLVLAGGGFLLNQANKRGWLDKIGDGLFGDATGAADAVSGVNINTAELPQAFSLAPAFDSNVPSGFGFEVPDLNVDFGAISDAAGSVADAFGGSFSGADFSSPLNADEYDIFGFADGGQPSRGRTNMGTAAPTTLQSSLQVSDAQMLAKLVGDAQAAATAVQPGTGAATTMRTREGSNDSQENTPNVGFSPDALGMTQSALKANSFANLAGLGISGLGPVSTMVNATSPQQMVAGLATDVVTMVNPVAGLIAKFVLSQLGGSDSGGGSSRGPGGSSGDPAAAAEGASAYGPGLGNGNDGRDSGGNAGGIRGGGSFGEGQYKDGGQPASGPVRGPGTGTSDSIPMPMAKVSNGEYIMSADVVNALGVEFFDGLQAAFHSGGKPA